jgi:4-carboxymuconolactone decarboxylase
MIAAAMMAGAVFAAAPAPAALPPDIHPQSMSRLPVIDREALDAEGKRVYDVLRGRSPTLGPTGPAAATIYSPGVAEPVQQLNQYLRKTVVGPRFFELSALIAARELDQAYEWSGHEPAGLKAGLEQTVIDVIKFDRDPAGLSEKDRTVILAGRALFRHDHKLSSPLWAKLVEQFGTQGAVEVVSIMADYAMAAIILNAVDQRVPDGRASTLPARAK